MAQKLVWKERLQIIALIGGCCLLAFVLQNFEGWHAKSIDDAEFEDVRGEIVSINLVPSNTGTTYVATILVDGKYKTQLDLSPARLTTCKIGKTVEIARRGLDHRWTKNSCSVS